MHVLILLYSTCAVSFKGCMCYQGIQADKQSNL